MRYLFVAGAPRRVMHIARFTATGEMLWSALCGIKLPFNRAINAPYGLGRPICKRCEKLVSR